MAGLPLEHVAEFVIVGLGSWGLSVLERAVGRARLTRRPARIHVVEPDAPGGVYRSDLPDYLVLNVPCGQISLWARPAPPGEQEPAYAVGLHEWAVTRGYRWDGYHCRVGGAGAVPGPGDFLPRRVMAEYLEWFYRTVVLDAPPWVEVIHHAASALDVVATAGGEAVHLDDGSVIEADHVVLTTGHTHNEEPCADGVRRWRPYPVAELDRAAGPGAPIAVEGMGLVAYDILAALTVARGGRFVEDRGDIRYERSGNEPRIILFSRSGVPYPAKTLKGADPTGSYTPVACTPEAFAALRSQRPGTIDFRAQILPLLLDEMRARYHLWHAGRAGPGPEAELRRRLAAARAGGCFDREMAVLRRRHGHFDPAEILFLGVGAKYESASDYERWLLDLIAEDLSDATAPAGSPVKAAQEVTRIVREDMRSVVEYGRLTRDSYIDFQSNIRSRISRLDAGPPVYRARQLAALFEAGVVRAPLGPAPELRAAGSGVELRSTSLRNPRSERVGAVVRGHLDMPSLTRSTSPLLRRLAASGRLAELSYDGQRVGSVALDEDAHPVSAAGVPQRTMSLLGVLTEGTRYFTHYVPSPRLRLRAVLDAEAIVEAVLG